MNSSKTTRIAIMGTRGVPAAYGGFETFAEELGTRLVESGYEVVVYCRYYGARSKQRQFDSTYKGMNLRQVRAFRHKYFETPLHSLFCFVDLFRRPVDLVLLCNGANSPFAWLVRCAGIPLLINVDGIERQRAKWNAFGKIWYWIGEKCSVLFANKIVADAEIISEYYKKTYNVTSAVIAYGAEAKNLPPAETLARFNLKAKNYLLYVSRLEPENNALGVIKAYKLAHVSLPLVIVGDAPYAKDYKRQLFEEARGQNIIFTGFQFGDAYWELRSNCYAYIQATEVGGTHPALVEAMACGNSIIANDVPEHREVLQEAGILYAKNDWQILAEKIKLLVTNNILAQELSGKAVERAQKDYSWETITRQYLELFKVYI